MKKTTIFAAFLAVFAIATSPIQADVITNWEFSVNSTFTSWIGPLGDSSGKVVEQSVANHTNPIGNKAGVTINEDATKMSWTSYDNKGLRSSSLELNSWSGTINTDGNEETALTMTHNNQTVGNSAPTPKIMEIAIDVLLTGMHEDGRTIEQEVTMKLLLGFIETPNSGFGMLNGHTEDDIFFVIENPSTTERFTDAEGNVYDVSMDAVFQELAGVYLDTAAYYIDERLSGLYEYDPTSPLYGWSTLENTYASNTMDVNIVVRHDTMPSTPEPGTMLIFAVAGAVGIPACRRLRKRAR